MSFVNILLSVLAAVISLRLTYLGIHVTLHPPEETRKQKRKQEFILLGVFLAFLVAGQEIRSQIAQKRAAEIQSQEMQAIRQVAEGQAHELHDIRGDLQYLRNGSTSVAQQNAVQQILDRMNARKAEHARVLGLNQAQSGPTVDMPFAPKPELLAPSRPPGFVIPKRTSCQAVEPVTAIPTAGPGCIDAQCSAICIPDESVGALGIS